MLLHPAISNRYSGMTADRAAVEDDNQFRSKDWRGSHPDTTIIANKTLLNGIARHLIKRISESSQKFLSLRIFLVGLQNLRNPVRLAY
jgi:hypothetical protein